MKPILIVEDETIMRESLRDWLTDEGYQVDTAAEGEEALKAIVERDFGLVILDLRLPGRDGIEVLREAKEKRPQLKGIIITAYPSVPTALEAMKEGAIDYLAKPFDLNKLEQLIRGTLGPVQVEIRPKAAPVKAVALPVAGEEAKVKAVIALAPEEIPVHLKLGKSHFEAGRYYEALKEFQDILAVAPGSIETRVWLRKAQEALTKPGVETSAGRETPVAEEVKTKECLWMRMGMVAQRICTNSYNCITCEFDQLMQEKMAAGSPELEAALTRLKELPGSQRLCRYAMKGDVSYRICSRVFQCVTCEFGQMMEEAFQQKLAKLAARREALLKKEKRAVAA
ncbi:MAG: Response regulator [Dehalococcoidales bacterium]|nr:Response regulator [Dehalococcoidales bacterium]